MESTDLREPSLSELCNLSVLGNVAYAVRCARRMQPRFRLAPTEPDAEKMKAVVADAILWAEGYVHKGSGVPEHGVQLARLTLAIAEATCEETEYSAYAAHHAVRGALIAARTPQPYDADAFMEIVAAAFGASRVLLANVPTWFQALLVKSLRSDYDILLTQTVESASQQGAFVDPSETGPLGTLWQGKTPSW